MVLMLWSSVHSIGSQMHNGRADLLFPTTHATRVLREWGAAPRTDLVIFRLAKERRPSRTPVCPGDGASNGELRWASLPSSWIVPNQVARFRRLQRSKQVLVYGKPGPGAFRRRDNGELHVPRDVPGDVDAGHVGPPIGIAAEPAFVVVLASKALQ
jgi:hypothetical protein